MSKDNKIIAMHIIGFAIFFIPCIMLYYSAFISHKPAGLHKFQVGDCFQYVPEGSEAWDISQFKPMKVLEIGRHSYHVVLYRDNTWVPEYNFEFHDEKSYEKVQCPD
jgi:hypothetical protein